MIVRSKDFGWEIIHQQAHGLLAMQVATHWQSAKRPIRWLETLVALTEHDDGQDPWEGRNHLTEAGAPMDFQILQYSIEQARRMVEIALEKSRWNALMVSMHASFLYESLRNEDAEMTAFLDEQRRNQKDWLKQLNVSRKEAQYAYDLVQWCDALSLILCQDRLPDEGRRLEISRGPDGVSYYIFERPDKTLGVDPWPFEIKEFEVHVEVYPIHQLQFKDDQELYNAIQQAPMEERQWLFKA